MRIVADYFYHFPEKDLGVRGRCRVRIFRRDSGAHAVVLSELASNSGEPITSACASIATDLAFAKKLNPKSTRWIQHDLPHEGSPQSFDEIKFTWQNDETATDPQWLHMNADEMEALTGSNPSDLGQRLGSQDLTPEDEV